MASEHECGSIDLILGCMWSGKTTELLRRIDRYLIAGKKAILLKPQKDVRYSETKVVTHSNSNNVQLSYTAQSVNSLFNDISMEDLVKNYDIIGIDEGNFFEEEIVSFCDILAFSGKKVIISALDGDYQRRKFGFILDLIPKSEHIQKLSAICFGCKKKAYFTDRTSNETEQTVIGGKDKYQSVCRTCFYKRHHELKEKL